MNRQSFNHGMTRVGPGARGVMLPGAGAPSQPAGADDRGGD